MKRWMRVAGLALSAGMAFSAGALVVSVGRAAEPDPSDAIYAKLALFARALHHIQSSYVDPVPVDRLISGAIRGMVGALDDHCAFLEPSEVESLRKEAAAGSADPRTVRFRALVKNVGYVQISRFAATTDAELGDALAILQSKTRLRGLVLDLRDDPGGLLDQAVRVADRWLAEGRIVSTRGRTREIQVELAHSKGDEPRYPIIVLVNQRTASAAEVVAAALSEHGRARLIGTRTYGKGSVQTVIELENHSALRLTIARYSTPKGRNLEGMGITPDRIVLPSDGSGPGVTLTDGQVPDPVLRVAITELTAVRIPPKEQ